MKKQKKKIKKYGATTVINRFKTNDKEEFEKIFNDKLLNVIIDAEKDNICISKV